MKLKYDFSTLVAIGNFNPAIVTLKFLNEICGLNLEEPVEQSPPNLPIVRNLKFKDFSLFLDFERFELKEISVRKECDARFIGIFKEYYKNLPHTPLKAVGFNIHCEFILEADKESDIIIKKINNSQTYSQFFKVSKVFIKEETIWNEKQIEWIASQFRIHDNNDLTRLINIRKTESGLNIVYNCEAGNLLKDISHLNYLLDNYSELCNDLFSFKKFLEAE